jgi:hypothetical protein
VGRRQQRNRRSPGRRRLDAPAPQLRFVRPAIDLGRGSSSLFATINGSLLYWNGSTWSLLNLPTSASQRLWALWGTGPSDIWAVGSAGRAVTFCTSR